MKLLSMKLARITNCELATDKTLEISRIDCGNLFSRIKCCEDDTCGYAGGSGSPGKATILVKLRNPTEEIELQT